MVAKIENVVEAALDPGPALALRMFHNALKENLLVKNKVRRMELLNFKSVVSFLSGVCVSVCGG